MTSTVAGLPEYDPDNFAYSWRKGCPYASKGVPASLVAQRISEIAARLGRPPRTDDLVEDSFNPESPYYSLVTQDMEEAALKYRRREVGDISGAIRVIPMTIGTKPARELLDRDKIDPDPVKAFHAIRPLATSAEILSELEAELANEDYGSETAERSWISAAVVAKTPEYYQQVIDDLKEQARRWSIRASQFSIFSKVVNAILELDIEETDTKEYDNTTETDEGDEED